jgi:hypothetical protein
VVREVRRRIAWRHVWPVPIVLAAVILVAGALMLVPGLDWGWWGALGGEGNPVFGSTDQTSGTVWEWIIPLAFMAMLLPALPLFAYAEERMFRGRRGWSTRRRVLKCCSSGWCTLIGIPVGAALALSLGGAYFMWVYLRRFAATRSADEATIESTTAHTVYNFVIVLVVIVAVVADTLA